MGGSHQHGGGHRAGGDVEVARTPRLVLLVALGLAALATVIGGVVLWPSGEVELDASTPYAASGVSFPDAEVTAVQPACERLGDGSRGEECGGIEATISTGPQVGADVVVQVPPERTDSGLSAGDTIQLLRTPGGDGTEPTYSLAGVQRGSWLGGLTIVFVVLVLAVARLRGLMALIGLAVTGVVVWELMLPAVLQGSSPPAVALVGCSLIIFVVLYTTHGFSLRTSAAVAGTLVGIALTAVIATFAVGGSRLTGVADEGAATLGATIADLDLQGLMTAAIIVAGLGVLNDVTITQASAGWELRGAAPRAGRAAIFAAGMRVGRDHIASTIYTIVFVYVGTALAVLLLIQVSGQPTGVLLTSEAVGQEVVRTLASAIALVLAVPVTTAIAVATLSGPTPSGPAESAA